MISITKILWNLIIQSDLFTKIIVYLLIIFSLLTIIIFLYSYTRLKFKKKEAQNLLDEYIKTKNFIRKKDSLIDCSFSIIEKININNNLQKDEVYEIFFHTIDKYFQKDKNIKIYFLIAAGSAPLVGLLGTVWGVIHAFMGMSSGGDLAAVAPGIAEALITTLAGLFVAIPSLVFYHFINNYIKNIYTTYDIVALYFASNIFNKNEENKE